MLNKRKWTRAGPGVMLMLGVLGFVPQASAAYDYKTYHSAMCVPAGSGVELTYTTSYAYSKNGPGSMYCPMAKDRWYGTNTQSLFVRVNDSNSSHNISCYFYIKDAWGSTTDWDSASTSGTPGNITLNMYASDGSSAASSNFLLNCYLPTGGSSLSLRSYNLSENNSND